MRLRVANPWNRADTIADVRLITRARVVVVTERADNEGMSITNNAEAVVVAVRGEYGDDVKVIEHYGKHSYPGGRRLPDTYDLVELDDDGKPDWTYLDSSLTGALAALGIV